MEGKTEEVSLQRNEAEPAGTLCGPLNKNGPHQLRDLNA